MSNWGTAWQCATCHGTRSHQPDCPEGPQAPPVLWDEPEPVRKPPLPPLVWPEFNDPKSGDSVGGSSDG